MGERPSMGEAAIFSIDVAHEEDGRPIVVVEGDVDLHTGPELRDRLAEIIDDNPRQIVIDLSAATFLDSMGLGVLLGAKKSLAAKGARIDLIVSNPDIRRIFELTMLDRVFDLHSSRSALAAADGAG
jgi:anti-sigma B factor antagonist